MRGTYAGVAPKPSIRYLKNLGVTAVELLPVHDSSTTVTWSISGLVNYWGYNTLGFFAPDLRYGSPTSAVDAVREFKTMVRNLHAAGIEVILDVVYNHTAEGNHLGPTLSFRGIDNASYYRLSPEDPRYYMDFTGCGNTLHMRNPRVLQLIMDSLRYWITHMHVDGFRFDLASTLARELHEVDKLGAFFDIIHQDPIISQVKLIAEPWDLGEGGYQVGNFPSLWSEWNGQVSRLRSGSFGRATAAWSPNSPRGSAAPAIFMNGAAGGPMPASISSPATTDSRCTIWFPTTTSTTRPMAKTIATEPTTIKAGIAARKARPTIRKSSRCARKEARHAGHADLVQGAPMLLAGDEIGHTQKGNNNAYCQDNELSWLHWDLTPEQESLLKFVRRVDGIVSRTAGLSPATLLPRPGDSRGRGAGNRLVRSERGGDVGRSLAERFCPLPGGSTLRRRYRRRRTWRRYRGRHDAFAIQRRSRQHDSLRPSPTGQ